MENQLELMGTDLDLSGTTLDGIIFEDMMEMSVPAVGTPEYDALLVEKGDA